MQNAQHNNLRRWNSVSVLIGVFGLLGCASGGTVMSPPSSTVPTENTPSPVSQPTGTNSPAAPGTGIDTGWTGSVAAPAPASFGSSPVPAQIATEGGPAFFGNGNQSPSNVSFPALSSSLQLTSSGLSAAPTTQSASILSYTQNGLFFSYRLVVPALNIDTTVSRDFIDWYGVSENYVYLDEWDGVGATSPGVVYFGYGFETPVTAVPTSGTAAFSGNAEGYIYSSVGGHILWGYVLGNAALSIDFGSGNISGGFTNMQAALSHTGALSPWNDVSLNASIAAG